MPPEIRQGPPETLAYRVATLERWIGRELDRAGGVRLPLDADEDATDAPRTIDDEEDARDDPHAIDDEEEEEGGGYRLRRRGRPPGDCRPRGGRR